MRRKPNLIWLHATISFLSLAVCIAIADAVPKPPSPKKFDADIVKVKALFEAKEYRKLNALFETYQELCEKDNRWEIALQNGFSYFAVANPLFTSRLNDWVQNTPESWVPLLARAIHYETLAQKIRGTAWAKDTTETQFQGMRANLSIAIKDVTTAFNVNPRLFFAHYLMIRMVKNSDTYNSKLLAKKALELYPASYLLRFQHMISLMPRWGGSHEEMEQFAQDSAKFEKKNPEIKTLKGFVHFDLADLAYNRGDVRSSIELYDKALRYGDCFHFLYYATDVYLDANMRERALDAISRAISLRPNIASGHIKRAKVLAFLNRNQESEEELDIAEFLGGVGSDEVPKTREWLGRQRVGAPKP